MDFDPVAVSKLNEKKITAPGSTASSLLSEPKLRSIIENGRQIVKVCFPPPFFSHGSFYSFCRLILLGGLESRIYGYTDCFAGIISLSEVCFCQGLWLVFFYRFCKVGNLQCRCQLVFK